MHSTLLICTVYFKPVRVCMEHPACRNLAERRAQENAQQRPSSVSSGSEDLVRICLIHYIVLLLILPLIF